MRFETLTTNDGRLRWKCRRGMLELDVLFERFLSHGYDQLDTTERLLFESLLEEPDPVILNWLMGHEVPDSVFIALIKKIRRTNDPTLILASSSPSRKMILDKLNIPYQAVAPDIDETVLEGEAVEAHVLRLSREKALKIAADVAHRIPTALIIGCDSVCVLNGEIMSKPESHSAAMVQLQAASGKIVYFYSGLALYHSKNKTCQQEVVRTEVHFKQLSNVCIEAYLKKDQPYHCAGSIKAEGLGVILVEKMIADDPNSLVGLPLIALIRMLEKEQFPLL